MATTPLPKLLSKESFKFISKLREFIEKGFFNPASAELIRTSPQTQSLTLHSKNPQTTDPELLSHPISQMFMATYAELIHSTSPQIQEF